MDERVYSELPSSHPIDLTRYQILSSYARSVRLIHSGDAKGKNDIAQLVRAAVINKQGGSTGLIAGCKAIQVPLRGVSTADNSPRFLPESDYYGRGIVRFTLIVHVPEKKNPPHGPRVLVLLPT